MYYKLNSQTYHQPIIVNNYCYHSRGCIMCMVSSACLFPRIISTTIYSSFLTLNLPHQIKCLINTKRVILTYPLPWKTTNFPWHQLSYTYWEDPSSSTNTELLLTNLAKTTRVNGSTLIIEYQPPPHSFTYKTSLSFYKTLSSSLYDLNI